MSEYAPSPRDWVAKQVELYESTNGREGASMRGMPVIIVTHRGRHTGAIRKTPLMRVKVDDAYLAVASIGGAPKHPLWYYNLLEHPAVTVRDGDKELPMRARLVEDPEERPRLWARAVEVFPDYAEYQTRTDRVIPVFLLEPA